MSTFTIDTATLEEAIVYAVTSIVAQGKRCMTASGRLCAYQNEEGHHCAIGWLLDHNNQALMDFDGSVLGLDDAFKSVTPKLILDHITIFHELQKFHDRIEKMSRIDRLREIERMTGISFQTKYPVFDEWIALGE